MQTQRDKLKVITGVPMIVQFEAMPPTQVRSQLTGETEYLYQVLYDNKPAFVYLPGPTEAQIREVGLVAGDYAEISNLKRGAQWIWIVRRVSDAAEPVPPSAPRFRNGDYRASSADAAAGLRFRAAAHAAEHQAASGSHRRHGHGAVTRKRVHAQYRESVG